MAFISLYSALHRRHCGGALMYGENYSGASPNILRIIAGLQPSFSGEGCIFETNFPSEWGTSHAKIIFSGG